jgi:hypothetical protein
VLSLGAFIGMPPVGCGAGRPITYQSDITLIAGLSMVAVLTGRLGDGASVRVTYPAAMRPSSRISVSAETSHNERFGAPPADLVERITTVQNGGYLRATAVPA